jgi:uncharacterized damage-inducible protein DinB
MKELLETYAWYNRRANSALLAIVQDHRDVATRDQTTYYGSLLALLSHVLLSDITWLRRLDAPDKVGAEVFDLQFSSLADQPFATVTDFCEHRDELDGAMETYCGALSEQDLSQPFEYRNSTGREFRHARWQALLHMFNHQTHHRGQVAQVLDDHGIENDVSNLVWYLRE